MVRLRPAQEMPTLALRVIQLLMDQSGGCLPLVELCSRYRSMFGVECDVQKIQEELLAYVQVSESHYCSVCVFCVETGGAAGICSGE